MLKSHKIAICSGWTEENAGITQRNGKTKQQIKNGEKNLGLKVVLSAHTHNPISNWCNFLANDDDASFRKKSRFDSLIAHYHTLAVSLLVLFARNYLGALLRIRLVYCCLRWQNELFTWTYNIHRIVLWNCFLNWKEEKKTILRPNERYLILLESGVCSIKYGLFAFVDAYKETHRGGERKREGERLSV